MTRYPNRCFFKNKSCTNNLFQNAHRDAYIPQGNKIAPSYAMPKKYIKVLVANGKINEGFFYISSKLLDS